MAPTITIVTVDNKVEKAKNIVAILGKALNGKFQLKHVANCENILSVEYVLSSLILHPGAVICSGRWFEDEDEEVREMSQRLFPDIKLIMVPSDLKLEAASDQDIVDYLKEQVESWKKE